MKKSSLILLIIICLIICSIEVTYIILSYSLKINGQKEVTINYNEVYEDAGASSKILKNIKTNSNVIDGKVGTYKVIYTSKYLIFKFRKTRIVNIVDNDFPAITLKGNEEVNICSAGDEYIEEGYEATDSYDGDLTSKVEIEKKSNKIIYKVKDTNNNETTKERIINYKDETSPVIALKDSNRIYVKLGNKYTEKGYTITDNCDKEVKVTTSGEVNIKKEGTYTIKYEATDSSGNTSSVERTVVVYGKSQEGVIYLTFDDGPSNSGSTKKILDVLKKYDIKATFFVTSSGSDSLIKREYDEGHTVALHTSSHKYSTIYSSVDNYYKDLNKVKTRVTKITGMTPTIIRFPGGSNNTVSNNYSKGIMKTLTKDVMEKGYIYFDWNVSGNDTGGCTDKDCVLSHVKKGLSKKRTNMVLLHDTKSYTADAIESIIQYGIDNGYEFRKIDETTPQVKF